MAQDMHYFNVYRPQWHTLVILAEGRVDDDGSL